MLAALRSRLNPHCPLATLSSFLLRRGFASQTPEILKLEEIEKVLADVKADNVRVVPVGKFCDWADFMVFATGRSDWHVKNIAQAIMYKAGSFCCYGGDDRCGWVCLFGRNDLKGLIFDTNNSLIGRISGEDILTRIFQIDVNRSKWIDLSVRFSMIIVYRVIFFLMIKINEDVTPWVRGLLARRRLKQQKKVSGNRREQRARSSHSVAFSAILCCVRSTDVKAVAIVKLEMSIGEVVQLQRDLVAANKRAEEAEEDGFN
ncbi:hypothetical protein Droror1_Dr00020877 [Drosera rotundifolia]